MAARFKGGIEIKILGTICAIWGLSFVYFFDSRSDIKT